MDVLKSGRQENRTLQRGISIGVVVVACLTANTSAQTLDTEAVVATLHAYLDAYEPKLSELVADEVFEQVSGTSLEMQRRRLVSDFGFLRLPGEGAWVGQRSVRSIDGLDVGPGRRLEDLLAAAGVRVGDEARDIALRNAAHNLGHPRTINTPTLPLELLGRRHASRYQVIDVRRMRLDGRLVTQIDFLEKRPGSIVAHDSGSFVTADVRVWVAADGALMRADVTMLPVAGVSPHSIRVDFAHDAAVALMVPVRLTESMSGRSNLTGTATYRNYRRFQTSGRLVPLK